MSFAGPSQKSRASGFKDAIAGRRDAALAHFQWVRDQGSKNCVEYEMAKGELRRLQER